MTESEISDALRVRAGDFAAYLLPDGQQEGKVWHSDAISIQVEGLRRGRWDEEGSSLVDLVMTVRGASREEALEEAAMWLGVQLDRAGGSGDAKEEPHGLNGSNGPIHGEPEFRASERNPDIGIPISEDRPALREEPPARVSYMPDIHRLLPHALDAEAGLIAALYVDRVNGAIAKMCAKRGITPEHFYSPANGELFDYMLFMALERMDFDLHTLTQHFRDNGRLNDLGGSVGGQILSGAAFITAICYYIPTTAVAEHDATTIQEKYAARRMIAVGTEFAARGYDAQDDIREVVAQFREEAATIEVGSTPRIRLPHLRRISEWAEEKDLPKVPAEVIRGILHRGSKLIIGGTSKGRKTFSLLDLAISVSVGKTWWGSGTTKGRVCYLNFELQEFAIAQRIRGICGHRRIPMTDDLMVMTLRGWTDRIENLSEKLIQYFRGMDPFDLIIFDPVYKLLGDRDENKVGDVTTLLNHIERIGVETGAATAFGHHYSKGNQAAKESIDRMGGSGAFARDPDAILAMTAHETEDAFTIEPTLRNFAPVPAFVVRWDYPVFVRADELNPTDLRQPRKPGQKEERANDMFNNALKAMAPVFRGGKIQRWGDILVSTQTADGKPASKGAISKWLNILNAQGLVEHVTVPYKAWMATEKWRDTLPE